MNIIIDGCEKAGKSTLIPSLVKELKMRYEIVDVLKWAGRAKPDDREYSDELRMYAASPSAIAIWDRSWASEYVYGKLLDQDRRMAKDPWLGAWLHDRAVVTNGLRVMMLGSSAAELSELRDSSDLDVNPEFEIQLFKEYAKRFGWLILEGYSYTPQSLKKNVATILSQLRPVARLLPLPPSWSGPQDAEVVFVGNSNNEKSIPGGWLPFTSRTATLFGRTFGDKALEYAWINARGCNPAYLRNRKVIIACGNVAQLWVSNYIADKENKNQKVAYIPHPSHIFKSSNKRMLMNVLKILT